MHHAAEAFEVAGVTDGRSLRFWYDNGERRSPLFHSINSLYLWGWVDLTKELPQLETKALRSLFRSNTTVVHLTTDLNKIGDRVRLMAEHNIVVGDAKTWEVRAEDVNFNVVLQDVIDIPSVR